MIMDSGRQNTPRDSSRPTTSGWRFLPARSPICQRDSSNLECPYFQHVCKRKGRDSRVLTVRVARWYHLLHWRLSGVQEGTDRKRFLRAAGLEGSPKKHTVQGHCLQIAMESRCGSFHPNPAELLDRNLCGINRGFTRFQALYARRNTTNLDWKGQRVENERSV